MINYLTTICLALLLSWNSAFAQTSDKFESEEASVALVSEVSSVVAGETFWLAITVSPRDGYYSFWQNAGVDQMGVQLEWELPKGISAGPISYPYPSHLYTGNSSAYGFFDPHTLLIPITVDSQYAEKSAEISLNSSVSLCKTEECLDNNASFNLSVAISETTYIDENEALFSDARSKMPEVSYWSAEMQSDNDEMQLLVHMSPEEVASISSVAFYPYSTGVLSISAEQSFTADDSGLLIRSARDPKAQMASNLNGVLTLTHTNGATSSYNLEVSPSSALKKSAPLEMFELTFFELITYALLGGLILNLMPCVFPILSLKALALMRSQENHHAEGIAYTAGILVSFLAIALTIIFLRAGGETVGWGFQLQEPTFVAAMVFVLVAVGLSLSGVYNIRLGIEGAGQSLTESKGTKGSFFTGVLAALVATPCTAPLMAPALAYAITQPLHITLIGFLMLGLGLALPFLLLSYVPSLSNYMPKPGPWMDKVKQGLAFPMYATAAWLIWVFTNQAGSASALMLMIGLIIFAFAIWLWQQSSTRLMHGISFMIIVMSLFVAKPDMNSVSENDILQGEPYSDMRLQELRDEGRKVFVYFSADWCITCKVNERMALFTEENRKLVRENNIAVLKGDWTNRNEMIAKVLARYNRMGIPLYLYFPIGADKPIILPEILAPSTITDIFRDK